MIKLLRFLGLISNAHRLYKFDTMEFKIQRYDRDFVAHLLARYSYLLNPEVDEDEATDIIRDFLREHDLTVYNIHQLAVLVRTTIFNPDRHAEN